MAKTNSYTLKEVVEHYLTDMKIDLGEIKLQTQRTNGRVNSLERSRVQVWTAVAILLVVGATVITLSLRVLDDKIRSGVEAALNERCGTPCVQVQQ